MNRIGWTAVLATTLLAGCGYPAPALSPALTESPLEALSQPLMTLTPQLPGAKGTRQAVLFSYVAMDDPMTSYGERFLGAIQDTAAAPVYDVAFGDFLGPDNSYLFYMEPGKKGFEAAHRSYLTPRLKEVSSNDPVVLASTVNWAFGQYPGTFKAMDIFSHGCGFFGFGSDQTTINGHPQSCTSVTDIGKALRSGLKGRKLDLLNMLSCLMGNAEFAYELRDVAEVLVASEDTIFANSNAVVDLTAELNRALAEPHPDARAIGKRLVIAGNAKNQDSGYHTLAAIDLARMGDLRSALRTLSTALVSAMPSHRAEILAAYDAVPGLESTPPDPSNPLDANRDLWTFCSMLQKVSDHAVQSAALETKATLRKVLIHARDREGIAAQGLSICLPTRDELAQIWDEPWFQSRLKCQLEQDTGWNQFLTQVRRSST